MPQTENIENSLIFYYGFKTVLTDQVQANKHKYKYTKSKQLNIQKTKIFNKKEYLYCSNFNFFKVTVVVS